VGLDDAPVAFLVQAASDGDRHAWDVLVERYSGLVWSVCRRLRLSDSDGSDVSQIVWLRLVEQLNRIREPAALVGWLHTTTRNECFRTLSAGKHVSVGVDTTLPQDPESTDPARRLLEAERLQALREGLEQVPEHCRRLLALLVDDPTPSYAEIAAKLAMPIGSIGPTRVRCLEKLRRCPKLQVLLETGGESVVDGR
jgi:RNA polymerase sigma factor (sigma-70 family)